MKNFLFALAITAALIGLFSWMDSRQPLEMGNGYVPKHKGDSGLILPGDGNEMANASIEPWSSPEQELATDNSVGDKLTPTADKTEAVATSEKITEEHNMNDIVLSFWHGVATVLIGETVALMVAVAWMKIRCAKMDGDGNG